MEGVLVRLAEEQAPPAQQPVGRVKGIRADVVKELQGLWLNCEQLDQKLNEGTLPIEVHNKAVAVCIAGLVSAGPRITDILGQLIALLENMVRVRSAPKGEPLVLGDPNHILSNDVEFARLLQAASADGASVGIGYPCPARLVH